MVFSMATYVYLAVCIAVVIGISIFKGYRDPSRDSYEGFKGGSDDDSNLEPANHAMELVNKQLDALWKNAPPNDPSKYTIPKPLFETMGIQKKTLDRAKPYNPRIGELETILNMPDPKTVSRASFREIEDMTTLPSSPDGLPTENQTNPHPMSSGLCRVITSSSSKGQCPASHPVFTGATFTQDKAQRQCDGSPLRIQPAKAHAEVHRGKVMEVIIDSEGSHYTTAPHVSIEESPEGIQHTASAIATIDTQTGTLEKIDIIRNGRGYTSPPRIYISKPEVSHYCHICCQTATPPQ
jgi:hypothetical protein